MTIQSKPSTDEYREGWDRVFGKRPSFQNMLDEYLRRHATVVSAEDFCREYQNQAKP